MRRIVLHHVGSHALGWFSSASANNITRCKSCSSAKWSASMVGVSPKIPTYVGWPAAIGASPGLRALNGDERLGENWGSGNGADGAGAGTCFVPTNDAYAVRTKVMHLCPTIGCMLVMGCRVEAGVLRSHWPATHSSSERLAGAMIRARASLESHWPSPLSPTWNGKPTCTTCTSTLHFLTPLTGSSKKAAMTGVDWVWSIWVKSTRDTSPRRLERDPEWLLPERERDIILPVRPAFSVPA